jgi:hypothetical protein
VELQQARLLDAQRALSSHEWPAATPVAARQAFQDAAMTLAAPRTADALLLLTAIRRLEAVCERIYRHTQDIDVRDALRRFREEVPHAKDLRDVLEHLDGYAVGAGHRPKTGAQEHWWPRVGADPDPFVTVGDLHVDLLPAAKAAVELSHHVQSIWHARY